MKKTLSQLLAGVVAVFLLSASSASAATTVISNPGTITINEDTSTTINFTISDADDTSGATVTVTAAAQAPGHPANPVLTPGGGADNTRTLQIVPAAGLFGNGYIVISAGSPGDAIIGTRSFPLRVLSVNDAPTYLIDGDVTATAAVLFSQANYVTLATPNDAGQTLSFTLANNNASLFSVQPKLTGSGANRTLTFTPNAGAGGFATVTITGKDNGGTGGIANPGVNINVQTFVIEVEGVNRAPSLTPPATLTTAEDTQITGNITVSDPDGDDLTLEVVSSSNTDVIPVGNVTFGGSGAARTVTISPAENQFGNVTITVRVVDDGTPNLTDTDSFLVKVLSVNDTPEFTLIAAPDQEVDATVGPVTVPIVETFSAGPDNETLLQTVTFLVSNDSPSLFTAGGQPKINASGTLSYTPEPTAPDGTAIVTVAARDNGTPSGVSLGQTFEIVINHVNAPPTISTLASQTLDEDGPVTVSITLADAEDPTGDSLYVTVTDSGNSTVVPTCNVEVSCSGNVRTVTITPVADEFTTEFFLISLTVTDADCGSASMSFAVRVLSVNDEPTFSLPLVLYGADLNGDELVVIDPDDGCITDRIGCFGREIIALAVSPIDGTLYGATSALDGGELVRIDTETGEAWSIGQFFPTGCTTCIGFPNTMGDLAFTSDGTLYGFSHVDDALYTVDLITGEGTSVGDDVGFVLYAGLAASGDDLLFFAKRTNGDLSTFDEFGDLSPVVELYGYGDDIYDMDFHPDGTLYAVIEFNAFDCGLCVPSDSQLVKIDITSGDICEIGPIGYGAQVRSIAFGNAPICAYADVGPVTIECFAKDIDPGDNDTAGHESAQIVTFTVENDNNALFATQPAISADGILTFTPNAEACGSAVVSVTLSDNGGTTNEGDPISRTQVFVITIKQPRGCPICVE